MNIPSQLEQQRLRALVDSASKHATDVNLRAVQVTSEISKEKTQYFEKLALASGATIALLVSFVGAHSARLQPPWLLRSALIVLVLAMIAAMYRNWKYPYYLYAVYARQDSQAKQEQERCKRDYVVAFPTISMEAGEPIDVPGYLENFAKNEKILSKQISESRKIEDAAFNMVKYVEWLTLFLIVAGMALIVALAWRNF
jgi:hypothetical protein